MSSNYPAGQYDDAFNPRRLGNWEVTKEIYSPPRERQLSNTRIVANAEGHLLPNIYRNACSSPWGSLDKSQWLDHNLYKLSPSISSCSTIRQDSTKIPKFRKKKIVLKEDKASNKRLSDFQQTSKEVVSTLKKLQLPVIWVIGLPTRGILSTRRNFCKQLADTLNFVYINLDERVDSWRQKQESPLANLKLPAKTEATTFRNIEHTVHKVTHNSNLSKRVKHKNVNICVETVIPTWTKEEFGGNVKVVKVKYSSQNGKTGDTSSNQVQACRLSFNLSEFVSRDTIFEMLQFAMFESLPTDGFVIEGFPYDRAEAATWEKLLYPSALALYFMEGSPITKTETKSKSTCAKERLELKRSGNSKLALQGKMIPVTSRYIKRFLPYSLPEAERICEKYEHKLIRIINAEDVVFGGGMNFLSCLVEKALSQYSNILSGKTKINYESDSENSYMSSGSALSKCDENDNSNFLHPHDPQSTESTPRKVKILRQRPIKYKSNQNNSLPMLMNSKI